MEVEDAFEKWLADWFSRNPSGELSPKTVWFVAMRLGYGQNADKIATLEAERDAYKAQANLYKHMVITCGVAATHSDANLTRTGSYAEKWNSQQAEQVRALRAERDALRADAERYRWLDDNRRTEVWNHAMSDVEKASAETLSDAIDAAIAAKEPNRE